LRRIGGSSLVEIAVDHALTSGLFDAVYVDTDSGSIEEQGIRAGAHSLGLRPAELSQDETPTSRSLFEWLSRHPLGEEIESVVILQPSSPLRGSNDLLYFASKLSASTNSAASCSEPWQPPIDLVMLEGESWTRLVEDFHRNAGEVVFIDGAIFFCRTKWFLAKRQILVPGETKLVSISRLAGLDVDDLFQLNVAKRLLENKLD